jgi:signal transduction histidine kinase
VFLTVLSIPLLLLAASWADRRRAESALRDREAEDDSTRRLTAENERRRLASDLHDSVTQSLSATVMMADVLAVAWERDPEQGRRMLAGLKHTATNALGELRSLLLELRGGVLPQASLPDLLAQLATELRDRTKASVELSLDDSVTLPAMVDLTFFRVAQEALNNIGKHASAANVHVSLQRTADGTSLSISDDGTGFADTVHPFEHLGIRIMQERTASVGAQLRIDTARGRGTSVTVTWSQSRTAPRPAGTFPVG